jgi:hypothetical protein
MVGIGGIEGAANTTDTVGGGGGGNRGLSTGVAGCCTIAATAFDFFLEPEAAAAIAALVGRMTWPSGPSLVCMGFGGSSVRTAGAIIMPFGFGFASRRS